MYAEDLEVGKIYFAKPKRGSHYSAIVIKKKGVHFFNYKTLSENGGIHDFDSFERIDRHNTTNNFELNEYLPASKELLAVEVEELNYGLIAFANVNNTYLRIPECVLDKKDTIETVIDYFWSEIQKLEKV